MRGRYFQPCLFTHIEYAASIRPSRWTLPSMKVWAEIVVALTVCAGSYSSVFISFPTTQTCASR